MGNNENNYFRQVSAIKQDMLKKIVYTGLLVILSFHLWGQKVMHNTSILNYQRGDHALLHFGFTLGMNYMDYKAVLSGS